MLATSCGKRFFQGEPQKCMTGITALELCSSDPAQANALQGNRSVEFYEDNPTYLAPPPGPILALPATKSTTIDYGILANARSVLGRVPSSLSMLIVKDGELAFESYFHNSATLHSNNIHSASKGIISALLGIAIARGYIRSVDEPLATYLPMSPGNAREKEKITLRHLVTMTAGFAWTEDETEYEIQEEPSWTNAILDLPLNAAPGDTFNYSTGQSHLLAAAISRAVEMPLDRFAQETLFDPLELAYEHWGRDPEGNRSGGYNLYMTPRALAKVAMMFLNQGKVGGHQIVAPEWVEDSWRPSQVVDEKYGYGYYWWLTDVGGHPGKVLWGYGGQYAVVVPDLNAVVVITNETSVEFPEWDGLEFIANQVMPALDPAQSR
jgi:CubicO group peptidase (beta-lactamase class C family)